LFAFFVSKKSFFCQPWFDPEDRTIVRSSGSNHGQEGTTGLRFSKGKLTCPLKSTDRKGLWDRLENWCPFLFILFHRFFFFLKKRAEKGRKRLKKAEKGRKRQGRDTRLENFFKKVNKRNIYIKKGRNTRITLRFSLLWYIFIILSFYIFLFIMADIA